MRTSAIRRLSLKERTQATLFRRVTTDATPNRDVTDPNTDVLRRNTLAAIGESAKRQAVEPLERRVPKLYLLSVVNNAHPFSHSTSEEDAVSLSTFDSQSTAVNSAPSKSKSANRLLTKLGRKAMAPLEYAKTRADFKELIDFFDNLSDTDRVNLGRYFNKPLLLKNIVKAGR